MEYEKRDIDCVSDGDVLAFEARGNENDYSNMLVMIMAYARADWFMEIASSWIFYESEGKRENLLSQARELRRKHA